MFRVVGYRDLRPLDWVSGKRMPLKPGAGHVCDRCGAEHAVVYEVLDDDTGKHYAVGSSCAKRQFGFEPSQDKEAKRLIKAAKEEEAELVESARQDAVAHAAAEVAGVVSRLLPPSPVADAERYPGAVAWQIGDSKALAAHGRTNAEAKTVALQGWYENRIRELLPAEWDKVSVKLYPEEKSRTTISMRRKAEMMALAKLR
jgi:hypothetical protein